MKTHSVTIYDIARQLNISKSTVSRALTGNASINPETRKKVLDLADKMDYERNILSIGLITKKTYRIGILVPEFSTSFFPQIVVGAQEQAAKAGYQLVISLSNDSYETEVANSKVMLSSQVDGILVSLSKETRNYDHLKKFYRKGIPVVFFNSGCDEIFAPKVVVNDRDASFFAVEHLIKSGRRRIAHLSGPPNLAISQKRLNGYLDALKRYGIPVCEDLIIPFDLTLNKVNAHVRHFMNLNPPADALFAINDATAVEAVKIIKEMGLRIPEDVAIVGFGDNYGSASMEPSLTTLSQPVQEIGRTAMDLLIGMINKDISQWKPITKSLEATLIIRGSTQAVRYRNLPDCSLYETAIKESIAS